MSCVPHTLPLVPRPSVSPDNLLWLHRRTESQGGGFTQRLSGFLVGFGTAGLLGTYVFLEEFKASGEAVEKCIKKAGAKVQKNQDSITLELATLKEQVKELREKAGLDA